MRALSLAIVTMQSFKTHALHSIIVSTSVAPWTPDTAVIGACLESIRACPALRQVPLYVVADAIPSEEEVMELPEVDAQKWAPQWRAKRGAYEGEYMPLLQQRLDDMATDTGGTVTLVKLPAFGHLVGTVRAGLEACGATDDDVVLLTQHDLKISDPASLSSDVPHLVEAISSRSSPVEYVLLNRDHNNAPRSTEWLCPEPAGLGKWASS
jgi:hypothetical protein